jgi:iron complex outermembrane recepter protein
LLPDAPNSYNLNEVTKSAFVQANIEHDVFGLPLKGNIGLRYLSTTNTVLQSTNGSGDIVYNGATFHSGPGADSTIGTQVTKDNTYSNFLPAINLALNLTDDKVLRFAFTKTIGGNDADALGKGLVVNKILACNVKDANGIAVFCASGGSQDGNPTLLPYLQNNVELSYEWYFSDNGLLSIGAFAVQGLVESKHDFVNRTDVADSDGVIRGYNPNTGQFVGYTQILSQINESHKGGIGKGLEVGLKQAFDFLPGIWSGFGVDTNFTYSPSTGSDHDFYQNLLPGQDNSKYQSNLALWYEKDGLQARIAHNYRSKRFVADTHVGDYYLAYYQKPTSYVDASVSYEFYENITAALQITNLTQEAQTYYNQWENNIDSQFYNERRTTLSLQAKF